MTTDERINGLGFADRLKSLPDLPYEGHDGLLLDREAARAIWTRVLLDDMKDHKGRCRPNDRAGKMGWFALRLTRQEILDLFSAAEAEGLIEEISPSSGAGDDSEWTLASRKMDAAWRRTDEGKKLTGLRGGGIRDTFKRLPAVARFVYGTAQILLGGTVVAILTAAGFGISGKSPEAVALLIAGAWAAIGALVFAGYVDERDLRRCAEAWPRMQSPEYRPARYAHATNPLRSPLPAGLFVLATVAAAVATSAVLLHGEKSPRDLPHGWWIPVSIALGVTALIVLPLAWNARQLRKAYRNEYKNRKAQFAGRPQPAERWPRRLLRIAQLVIPRF